MGGGFEGRTVIVTGAGLGIGYHLCEKFAEAGALVALNDIDGDRARRSAATVNGVLEAERVFPYALDVADVDAVVNMVDGFADTHGRLDIVVANAGLTSYGPFLEYTPERFDRLTSVNLRGTYFTAQSAAKAMIRTKTADARILLMASVTGARAFSNLGAYGATKAAISHLAKSMALELGPRGITANAISPGATLTERTVSDDPDFASHWAGVTPTGRVGTVEDVAAAALFLASPQAQHITGQTIQVDGGWTLPSPVPAGNAELP
jgi:glucose 1-dehydrogenase